MSTVEVNVVARDEKALLRCLMERRAEMVAARDAFFAGFIEERLAEIHMPAGVAASLLAQECERHMGDHIAASDTGDSSEAEALRREAWLCVAHKAWPAVSEQWNRIRANVIDNHPAAVAVRQVLEGLATKDKDELAKHADAPAMLRAAVDLLTGDVTGFAGDRELTDKEALRVALVAPTMTLPVEYEPHLRKAMRSVGLRPAKGYDDDGRDADGLIWPDGPLVKLLDGIGGEGQEKARIVRENCDEGAYRKRWIDDPLRPLRFLALALWREKVRPKLDRSLNRTDSPGLVMPVLTNLVAISHRGAQQSLLDDKTAEILDHRGRRVGSLKIAPTIDEKHVSLAALGKLTTQRLVRFLLWEGYRRKWIEEEPLPGVFMVEGGYSALARHLGMEGGKAAEEVKEALATLASVRLNTPSGEGQVFGLYHHKAHRGRTAQLEMHLMGPFAPDYIARQLQGHRVPSEKWLVPIPLPRLLPPLVGREREHAAQAHLQLLALRELRTGAEQMAATGSVEIVEKRWRCLAEEAGVPSRILPDILAAYPKGDAGGRPAFLDRPAEWRFALAEPYEAERATILAAAKAQQLGRKKGKRSAQKRRCGRPGS